MSWGQTHRALNKDAISWLCVNGWISNFDVAVAIRHAVPYLGQKKAVTGAKAPRAGSSSFCSCRIIVSAACRAGLFQTGSCAALFAAH